MKTFNMQAMTQIVRGLTIAAMATAISAPAFADSSYVPVGVATVTSDQSTTTHPSEPRPIIVHNGPIIVVPGLEPAPAPLPQLQALPLSCLETVETNRGTMRGMGVRCLNDAGIDARGLPSQCGTTHRVRGGLIRIYDPACLGAAGYQLAGF